jgi:hypothetical protein
MACLSRVDLGLLPKKEASHNLLPSTTCDATPHDLSSLPTPRRNNERSSSTKYACSNKGKHAPLTPQGLRRQLSPSLDRRYPCKTTQHRQAVRIGTVSYYLNTGQWNGHITPTHYGMGLRSTGLTSKPTRIMTLKVVFGCNKFYL